jgi:hypothetical protein
MTVNNRTAETSKERISIKSEHCRTFVEKPENDKQTRGVKQHDFHPNCQYVSNL